MQSEKLGPFICALRKENHMTQKDLAEKLHITDKAVSKWERNLSCPDISLLPALAGALGVTVAELLNGERDEEAPAPPEHAVQVLDYAEKTVQHKLRSWQSVCAIAFSALIWAGIFVCVICDLAVNGRFTWSVFAVSSILFGWLVLLPPIRTGRKGLVHSLLLCSVLIWPFLYVLGALSAVSVKITALSILFAWTDFFTWKQLKDKILLAAGLTALLAAGLHVSIQLILL